MFRLHSLHIFQHFLYIIHTSQTHMHTPHTHTCTHTHVFCQHFREMGSHENWERETEIKIGVWQAKEKTLPDPPPLHIAAGRVARPIAAPTCAEEGKRERTVEGREMRPTFLVPRLAPAVATAPAATATDAAVNVSAGVAILFQWCRQWTQNRKNISQQCPF